MMHVPYEVFWHLNPRKLKPFEKAFEMEIEARQNARNLEAWLNGLYNQNAIASVFNSKNKYPKKPFEIFGAQTKTPEDEAEEFKRYVEKFNARRNATKPMG